MSAPNPRQSASNTTTKSDSSRIELEELFKSKIKHQAIASSVFLNPSKILSSPGRERKDLVETRRSSAASNSSLSKNSTQSKRGSLKFKSRKSGTGVLENEAPIIEENEIVRNDFEDQINQATAEPVDYEKVLPEHKCADLITLKYVNEHEKYLITRIYSNLNRLSSIVENMDSTSKDYFLNTPDQNDCLPLYYAVKSDSISAVKYLIKLGSDLNRTTRNGDPAQHLACLLGCSIELIEYLISFDAPLKTLYKTDQEGWNILHCSCNEGHLDIVRYLIEEKHMNPNVKDAKKNHSCLQLAVINNRVNILEYFLTFNPLSSLEHKSFSMNVEKREAKKLEEPKQLSGKLPSLHLSPTHQLHPTFINIPFVKSTTSLSKAEADLPIESGTYLTSSKSKFQNGTQTTTMILQMPSKSTLKSAGNKKTGRSNKSQLSSKVVETPPLTVSTAGRIRIKLDSTIDYASEILADSFGRITQPAWISSSSFVIIDLLSKNNEGQNILHLACQYGNYSIVSLLLKKFGSHQLDINAQDFKGHTCLDLAWNWLIHFNSRQPPEDNTLVSFFYDKDNSYYIQRNLLVLNAKLDKELKLINLLNSYGAKFSTSDLLIYNIDGLNKSIKEYSDVIHLPTVHFNPKNSSIEYNQVVSIVPDSLIPIDVHLKCLNHLLKNFKLPNLFLKTNAKNVNINLKMFNDHKETTGWSSFSSSSSNTLNGDSSNHTKSFMEFKPILESNLNEMAKFICETVVDSFERELYIKEIKQALDILSSSNWAN